jgi:tRNA-dihydrouridine synthase B
MPLPVHPDQPWLAPLTGFSDLPFRLLCKEQGAAVTCTEMISTKGLVSGNQATERLLATHPQDQPLVVQLYGADPDSFIQAMEILLERGFSFFDLNAGCSVPKVVKTGSGAALLHTPGLLKQIVANMLTVAGVGNVGVKLRLGWRVGQDIVLDFVRELEDMGVGWLTLHPRWATQGFSGEAQWEWLHRLRKAVSIPVIASGDLFTAEDAQRCLESTGVSGVMFARGALWDPSIFGKYLALRGAFRTDIFELRYCLALVRRHMVLSREHHSDSRALLTMRTVAPRYLHSFPGAKPLRQRLTTITSWAELEDLLGALSDHSGKG